MTKQQPYLYPDIPTIAADDAFYPLKAFVVALELCNALGPRLCLDGRNDATGSINCLDGPASEESFLISLPFDKLREFLSNEEKWRRANPIVLDGPGMPSGFTFGMMDIVTYPFWFMLTYSIALDEHESGNQLWQVNSNLLNHFYPSLRGVASVLSIPHYQEEPIDDAPIHNIVLWPKQRSCEDTAAIRSNLRLLTQSDVPTHFVCPSQPFMDDRYALHERRPGDGKPFNLLALSECLSA